MLTIKELKKIPSHAIFACGTALNSPEGIYMTDTNPGRELLWVAVKGGIEDWAKNRFVDRKEALQIATMANQLNGDDNNPVQLYSEDIY